MQRLVLLLILIVCNACKPEDTTPPTTVGEAMAKLIDDALQPTGVGYAFEIRQGDAIIGQTAGGLRAKAIEIGGALPMNLDTRVCTGSSTKTVTGIAFLKLASQKGIKTTDKIAPYLPPSWKLGKGVESLRFIDLLQHRSGFRVVGVADCQSVLQWANGIDGYEYIRNVTEQDILSANKGLFCYFNPNVTLFRFLIPSILGYQFTGNDATDDVRCEEIFLNYIQTELFDKLNIFKVSANTPDNGNFAYLYEYPSMNLKGATHNGYKAPGSGGLQLSAKEAAKFFHSVVSLKDGVVLPKNYSDTLLNNYITLFSRGLNNGLEKQYQHGGGSLIQNCSTGSCIYQGLGAVWTSLPDKITCTLLVNAENRDGTFILNQGIDEFLLDTYIKAQLRVK